MYRRGQSPLESPHRSTSGRPPRATVAGCVPREASSTQTWAIPFLAGLQETGSSRRSPNRYHVPRHEVFHENPSAGAASTCYSPPFLGNRLVRHTLTVE